MSNIQNLIEEKPFTAILGLVGILIGLSLPTGLEMFTDINFMTELVNEDPSAWMQGWFLNFFISILTATISGMISAMIGLVIDKIRE